MTSHVHIYIYDSHNLTYWFLLVDCKLPTGVGCTPFDPSSTAVECMAWGMTLSPCGDHEQLSCFKGIIPVLCKSLSQGRGTSFFSHIFVWGSCFWFCTPASGPPPPPASSSYNLPTHNLSSHNLSTHNFRTRNLSTHNLSTFTTCPHTTCPPSLCVAGVAFGDSHLQFAWQAWHLWHGKRGTWRHGPPLCVAFLRHFAWQARHLATSTVTLRGRRGTW